MPDYYTGNSTNFDGGQSGGNGMPGPLALGMGALGLAQGFMGNDKQPESGNTHLTNAGQGRMWNYMAQMLGQRQGDFGGGQAYKQGAKNVQNMLATSGISPQSGAAAGAYGNVAGQAGVADSQNYQNAMFRLLGQNLQTHQSVGPNMVRTSQTYGAPGAQVNNANAYGARRAGKPWYA